jgi:hypothetical protein
VTVSVSIVRSRATNLYIFADCHHGDKDMTQSNLPILAKQGNAKALAAMLNQSLQPKSITVKVSRKDDCLQILLESARIANQQTLVPFIRNGLIKLEVESIRLVKVYGRQTGEESPAWSQEFEILSQLKMLSSTEQTDFQNLLSHQTVPRTPRPVSLNVETEILLGTGRSDLLNSHISSTISQNPGPHPFTSPLSIGNVVSSRLVLYRSHLKSYLGVALFATLWATLPFLLTIPMAVFFTSRVLQLSALLLIIPLWIVLFLYCFAQSLVDSALIARLGFSELLSKPETVKAARNQLNPYFLFFLFQSLLIITILLIVSIISGIIALIIAMALGLVLNFLMPVLDTIVAPFLVIFIIMLVTSWFYSRLMVAEVVLAVEEGSKVLQSIKRSWNLSQNSEFRLLVVVLVAFLVTLPIMLLTSYLPQILVLSIEPGSASYWMLYLISVVLSTLGGALLMPFWKTLKAVVYYDLRNRHEGLGLQLPDSR